MSAPVLAGIIFGLALGVWLGSRKVREEWARTNLKGAKAAVRMGRPIWWNALGRYVVSAVIVAAVVAACLHLYVTRSKP